MGAASSFEERSFSRLRPSPQFLKKFLLSESCSNFLEWLAELAENSWKFPRSLQTLSLTHTCPACLSILFHTGDIQVLGNCTQLTNVDFWHCDKITGACCSEERSFRLRPSALFLWNIPFFGVTDSALPTLYSTSLPRGLMPLPPFVLRLLLRRRH